MYSCTYSFVNLLAPTSSQLRDTHLFLFILGAIHFFCRTILTPTHGVMEALSFGSEMDARLWVRVTPAQLNVEGPATTRVTQQGSSRTTKPQTVHSS